MFKYLILLVAAGGIGLWATGYDLAKLKHEFQSYSHSEAEQFSGRAFLGDN
ncbi:hypothetical protein [Altererythrobacter sp.]|uniref:hypothetical protein n=1 Tax=Altererythrobacter sp. TaxID=1872480 RepID=UPI003CFF68FD